MGLSKVEAIAKIQCDFGVNGVHIRPVGKGWAILHQKDMYHAETIYEAATEQECREVLREAVKEVRK